MAGFESQVTEFRNIGCEKVFQEQVSSVGNRVQLNAALEFVRKGDVLMVSKLDRLTRFVRDLMTRIYRLERKQVGLYFEFWHGYPNHKG